LIPDDTVTLLLVKIFLDSETVKKVQAVSTTYNKNFVSRKSSYPKCCVIANTAPDFCRDSVVQQRISGGGEGCEEQLSSTVYMAI
jgi:hypothetical protein